MRRGGLTSRPWARLRQQVLDANPLCKPCLDNGKTTLAQEVDHIKPLHKGGGNELDNLQAICVSCHIDKTAQDAKDDRPRFGLDGWFEG